MSCRADYSRVGITMPGESDALERTTAHALQACPARRLGNRSCSLCFRLDGTRAGRSCEAATRHRDTVHLGHDLRGLRRAGAVGTGGRGGRFADDSQLRGTRSARRIRPVSVQRCRSAGRRRARKRSGLGDDVPGHAQEIRASTPAARSADRVARWITSV
jgi:hypothetical protein